MSCLRFDERALVRTIHAPEEDRRDWAAIDRFAAEIAADLEQNVPRCPDLAYG
jgi:hypothetical protein